jgi:hypothetical protein
LFSDKDGIIIERDASQNNLGGYKKLIRVTLTEPKQMVVREDLLDLIKIANQIYSMAQRVKGILEQVRSLLSHLKRLKM